MGTVEYGFPMVGGLMPVSINKKNIINLYIKLYHIYNFVNIFIIYLYIF